MQMQQRNGDNNNTRVEAEEDAQRMEMMTPRSGSGSSSYSSDYSSSEQSDGERMINWEVAAGLPAPPAYVVRATREVMAYFVYEDVPFSGTKVYTCFSVPESYGLPEFHHTQAADFRPLSPNQVQFQFVWTQPDAREAEDNSDLKDRCWILFSRTGSQSRMEMDLGLVPDPSDPYAGGLEIRFVVRKLRAGVFEVDSDLTVSIHSEADWEQFVGMLLEPKIIECEHLDAPEEDHSGHATDMEEDGDA